MNENPLAELGRIVNRIILGNKSQSEHCSLSAAAAHVHAHTHSLSFFSFL